jgi:hypothetical protein
MPNCGASEMPRNPAEIASSINLSIDERVLEYALERCLPHLSYVLNHPLAVIG